MTFAVEDIGKIVSFSVYPAAILGTGFDLVKLEGIVPASAAFQYIDAASMHANVYPTLPPGTPNRFDAYLYALIRLANGTMTCVGLPWIDNGTIAIASSTTFVVNITDVTPDDLQQLREALLYNGFNKFTIEVVNS